MIGARLALIAAPGLLAIVTTIIGATIAGRLALTVFGIATDRRLPHPTETEIDLTEGEAVANAESASPVTGSEAPSR